MHTKVNTGKMKSFFLELIFETGGRQLVPETFNSAYVKQLLPVSEKTQRVYILIQYYKPLLIPLNYWTPQQTRDNVGFMLGQRRRRWTNIKPTLGQYIVFSGFIWIMRHLTFNIQSVKDTRAKMPFKFHIQILPDFTSWHLNTREYQCSLEYWLHIKKNYISDDHSGDLNVDLYDQQTVRSLRKTCYRLFGPVLNGCQLILSNIHQSPILALLYILLNIMTSMRCPW